MQMLKKPNEFLMHNNTNLMLHLKKLARKVT